MANKDLLRAILAPLAPPPILQGLSSRLASARRRVNPVESANAKRIEERGRRRGRRVERGEDKWTGRGGKDIWDER